MSDDEQELEVSGHSSAGAAKAEQSQAQSSAASESDLFSPCPLLCARLQPYEIHYEGDENKKAYINVKRDGKARGQQHRETSSNAGEDGRRAAQHKQATGGSLCSLPPSLCPFQPNFPTVPSTTATTKTACARGRVDTLSRAGKEHSTTASGSGD